MLRNDNKDKPAGKENITLTDWQEAVTLIANVLNDESKKSENYHYAVIGSGAYVLHGTTYENPKDNPADIDITTTNPAMTRNAILALQTSGKVASVMEERESSLAVNKFQITFNNGKKFEFEFTHAEDFGFDSASLTTKNNISVTSLVETLKSIYLRPEHRLKDFIAYTHLIQSNLASLPALLNSAKDINTTFKQAVMTMVNILSNPETANNKELIIGTVTKQLPRLGAPKLPTPMPHTMVDRSTYVRPAPTARQQAESKKRELARGRLTQQAKEKQTKDSGTNANSADEVMSKTTPNRNSPGSRKL